LGAYGQVGRAVSRLLLQQTGACVVLAGRRIEELSRVAQVLDQPQRVRISVADAGQPESLRAAFRGADLVIFTATARDCVEHVARACLECQCDYVDTLETEEAMLDLRRLEPEIQRAGRLFVGQCGLAPGMSAVLLRHAHGLFQRLRRARVAMAFTMKTIERKEQIYDIFDFVLNNKPVIYEDGRWQPQSLSADRVVIDCGPRFGPRAAVPLDMFETRELPARLQLERFGYYATGGSPIVEMLVRRTLGTLHRLRPRLGWSTLASFALWLTKHQEKLSGGAVIVEAEGDGGRDRSLHLLIDTEDNYGGVAQAAVVVAAQRLDGALRGKTGVHLMGEIVDPAGTIADMTAAGIPCRETWRATPLFGA
jgi:hypothetical protein